MHFPPLIQMRLQLQRQRLLPPVRVNTALANKGADRRHPSRCREGKQRKQTIATPHTSERSPRGREQDCFRQCRFVASWAPPSEGKTWLVKCRRTEEDAIFSSRKRFMFFLSRVTTASQVHAKTKWGKKHSSRENRSSYVRLIEL